MLQRAKEDGGGTEKTVPRKDPPGRGGGQNGGEDKRGTETAGSLIRNSGEAGKGEEKIYASSSKETTGTLVGEEGNSFHNKSS